MSLAEDRDWCQTLRQCSDGNSEAQGGVGTRPGKEEPQTNLLSPASLVSQEIPRQWGPLGCFFHFLVVLFISGNLRLHTSLHPHPNCICTAEAWYPPCLLSTNYTHKVQVKNLSDSIHCPLNAGPQDIAPGRGCRLPERGSAGHTARQAWGQGKGEPVLPSHPGWGCRMEKGDLGFGAGGRNWGLSSSKDHPLPWP